ncbi:MAG: hypothetical protein KAY65_02265 [Planctomycetes bacterium]|nr:hypothetical protein [Planctomycetota bacterium]
MEFTSFRSRRGPIGPFYNDSLATRPDFDYALATGEQLPCREYDAAQVETRAVENDPSAKPARVMPSVRKRAMLISEHQFYLLAERYKLSPTQKVLVRNLLKGVFNDRDMACAMGIAEGTVHAQLGRISKKMHTGSRAGILYEFISEAKSISP